MKKGIKGLVFKVLILTILFATTYYLINNAKNSRHEELLSKEIVLTTNITNLSQNRIAYIELLHLDSNSPSFNIERSDLVTVLKDTNQKGLEDPNFPADAKEIYQRQNELLEKVFATNSFEEGVAILKSQEGLELLVDQTNLLHRLQRELEVLEKQLD